jgi:hypothetical protein
LVTGPGGQKVVFPGQSRRYAPLSPPESGVHPANAAGPVGAVLLGAGAAAEVLEGLEHHLAVRLVRSRVVRVGARLLEVREHVDERRLVLGRRRVVGSHVPDRVAHVTAVLARFREHHETHAHVARELRDHLLEDAHLRRELREAGGGTPGRGEFRRRAERRAPVRRIVQDDEHVRLVTRKRLPGEDVDVLGERRQGGSADQRGGEEPARKRSGEQ